MGIFAAKEQLQPQLNYPSPTDGLEFPDAFDLCALQFVLQKQAGVNCLWLRVDDLFGLANNLGLGKWESFNVDVFKSWLCEEEPHEGKIGIELLPRILCKNLDGVTNPEKQIIVRFFRVLARRCVMELTANPVTINLIENNGKVDLQLATSIEDISYETCVSQPDFIEILELILSEGVNENVEDMIAEVCDFYATNGTLVDSNGQVLEKVETFCSYVPLVGTPYFYFTCPHNRPRDALSTKLSGFEWSARAGEITDANVAKLCAEFGSVNATLASLQINLEQAGNQTDHAS